MQKIPINIILPEGNFYNEVLAYEESDRAKFRKMYQDWITLSNDLVEMGGRKINLPEALSEGLFALEMGAVRLTEGISGANTSFDCYGIREGEMRGIRIQVKACSVLPDLTSFGPKSIWDELYFVDFHGRGGLDGTFDIYYIPNELIYNHKVSATQTMRDQQEQGRRPRFSIYKEIIIPMGIAPIRTCRI